MFRINWNPVKDQEEQQNVKHNLTSNLKLEKRIKLDFNITYLLESFRQIRFWQQRLTFDVNFTGGAATWK